MFRLLLAPCRRSAQPCSPAGGDARPWQARRQHRRWNRTPHRPRSSSWASSFAPGCFRLLRADGDRKELPVAVRPAPTRW